MSCIALTCVAFYLGMAFAFWLVWFLGMVRAHQDPSSHEG
jgi:hypothetical protein